MAVLRLGGEIDPTTHQRTADPVTLPSEELTTHGVIVGMTGSGKTGLGVVLIEECLAAGVPALLIDPKGDLTNLALTFPDLTAEQFQPWVDPAAAGKAGQSVAQFAAAEAGRWTEGLAGWELGAAQVRHLHDAAEVTVYTPAASHGVGLNVLGSLEVPADTSDPSATAEEIEAYVSSLLHLVGIDADPLASPEHILLSTIISDAWAKGRSLDLGSLVAAVAQPPFRKVGVLELDTYYPPAERTKLANRLNGLLASPAFAPWLTGQRIDIESMLHGPDGRPRCAVVTTAHLSDEQRQSVTSVILAKLISWMRRQSGTADLRALLYLDEVAGYLPPNGNPPTKAPLLLLLKQARAFGVGVVLSTQNPVDVDYKALSNAGTWLIGRLQTEQDKSRLLDGLTSAAGTIDVGAVADTISALGKREFVLKRASKDTVTVLTSRWAMSYLRGPLTREQVSALTRAGAPDAGPQAAPATAPEPAPDADSPLPADSPPRADSPLPADSPLRADETPVPARVAGGIPVYYLDPAASWAASVGAVPGGRLTPAVIARVRMRFDDERAGIVHDEEYEAVLLPLTAHPGPEAFRPVDYDDRDLLTDPPADPVYTLAPAEIATKTWWTTLQRALADQLTRTLTHEVPANPALRLYGRIGEADDLFAQRCQAAAAEGADREIATLQSKYERKIATLQARLTTAQKAVARQTSARNTTVASDAVGGLLGGLFGGRRTSMTTAARRATAAQNRVEAAQDRVDDLAAGMADLGDELQAEADQIRTEWTDKATAITTETISLERSDVRVSSIGLVWIPMPAPDRTAGPSPVPAPDLTPPPGPTPAPSPTGTP